MMQLGEPKKEATVFVCAKQTTKREKRGKTAELQEKEWRKKSVYNVNFPIYLHSFEAKYSMTQQHCIAVNCVSTLSVPAVSGVTI